MTRKICRRSLLVCWSVVLSFSLYGFSCDSKKTDPGSNGNFDISLSGSVTKHFHGKNARFQIEQNKAMEGHPDQITVILVDDDGFRMTPFHFEKQLKTGSYMMDGNPQTGALFGSKDHPTQYLLQPVPSPFPPLLQIMSKDHSSVRLPTVHVPRPLQHKVPLMLSL